MIIIDDFIPKSLQENIKKILFHGSLPWYFTEDVTFGTGMQQRPCMTHMIYRSYERVSNLDFDYLAHQGAEKFGINFTEIINAKTILQFPLTTQSIGTDLDKLHVDIDPPRPHLVVLYYVMDADGDTIICDKVADTDTVNKELDAKDFPVLARVTPKQGRVVLFDGSYYHTAEQPKNGLRCIVNFNVA